MLSDCDCRQGLNCWPVQVHTSAHIFTHHAHTGSIRCCILILTLFDPHYKMIDCWMVCTFLQEFRNVYGVDMNLEMSAPCVCFSSESLFIYFCELPHKETRVWYLLCVLCHKSLSFERAIRYKSMTK